VQCTWGARPRATAESCRLPPQGRVDRCYSGDTTVQVATPPTASEFCGGIIGVTLRPVSGADFASPITDEHLLRRHKSNNDMHWKHFLFFFWFQAAALPQCVAKVVTVLGLKLVLFCFVLFTQCHTLPLRNAFPESWVPRFLVCLLPPPSDHYQRTPEMFTVPGNGHGAQRDSRW